MMQAMGQGEPAAWAVLGSREAYRGRWVGVTVDTVQLPTGASYEYTRLEPAGIGVGVIGFNAAGEILLEREYRHGVGEVIWQIPGGLAAPGEDLLAAGLRELQEETGFAPPSTAAVRYLGAVWDNPALGVAHSHIFLARDLAQSAETDHDHGEFVSLHWVTREWIKEAVRSGAIKDRVVVAAVAFMLLNGDL